MPARTGTDVDLHKVGRHSLPLQLPPFSLTAVPLSEGLTLLLWPWRLLFRDPDYHDDAESRAEETGSGLGTLDWPSPPA